MSVDVDQFITTMTQHWVNELGNHFNPTLQAQWRQMAVAFNRVICGSSCDQWQVLQLPTGTGKTKGLELYCSLLPTENHPGVIIVVRLKRQADAIASNINALVQRELAAAYHTDNRLDALKIRETPILVITHRAYEISLDAISRNDAIASNWDKFRSWGLGDRRLTVIDEALDVIEHAQVTLQDLSTGLGHMRGQFVNSPNIDLRPLERIVDEVEGYAKIADGRKEHMVPGHIFAGIRELDITTIREELHLIAKRAKRLTQAENTQFAHTKTMMKALSGLSSGEYHWYAKKGRLHTLNSARLIVPRTHAGAVVLDATASPNLIYELLQERASLIPAPYGARRYDNVTLHVSKGHKVGKEYLTKNVKLEWPALCSSLKTHLQRDRKVFVVCHKDVHAQIKPDALPFANLRLAHWGEIDGRNDWQDQDAVAIFGLPFPDAITPANTFMAIQGPQSDDWLNKAANRSYGNHRDIRQALATGQIISQVVQAINRVHCRRLVDEVGNCALTDAFILLPHRTLADEILNGIRKAMPGIRIADWKTTATKVLRPKKRYGKAIVDFLRTIPKEGYSKEEVCKAANISSRTFDRAMSEINEEKSVLAEIIASLGIKAITRRGRGGGTHFIKTTPLAA